MGVAAMATDKEISVWDQASAGIALLSRTSLRLAAVSPATPPAKGDRRPLQERIEAAAREDAVSVALAQPHRRGSDDPRLSEPLGRFVAVHRLRPECYEAGNRYAEIVKEAKSASGFNVAGWAPGGQGDCDMTDAQRQARKELALSRREKADAELRSVMARAPRVMERLCYDQSEPSPYDESLIRHCLFVLSDFFGLVNLGINREK
jgi:hypothetical protein